MLRRIGKQSVRNPWSQSWRRKGRLRWEGFAEKGGFKPGITWSPKKCLQLTVTVMNWSQRAIVVVHNSETQSHTDR